MALHVHLHDPDEEEMPALAVKPAGVPRAEHTDQQQPQPQLQPAGAPQSDPFHALVGSHHAQLAQFHAGMAKRAIDPEEAQAHQVAERAHGVASKAHESELEESGKISDMAHRASGKAHELSRARSFRR